MRRLAAKRQREAPPERSGKLLTNVGPAAGRGEGSAAAQHQTGPGPSSLARPGCGPWAPPWHSPARRIPKQHPFACASVSPRAALPWQGCQAGLGSSWGAGGTRGWSGRPGRAPHPPCWQPARHKPVFTPPRHSPGAGCAGCVEPGVPSPGPAPPCQHTGHLESPPALQPRAPSCGDICELHPGLLETDTIPPKRSLGSSDTCSPGFGCGRKCSNIPWSPALWRLLPWLSHGSQAPEGRFFAVTPPPVFSTQGSQVRAPPLARLCCCAGQHTDHNWRSTSLPEMLGKHLFLLVLCHRLSSHPLILGNDIPTLLACKYPMSLLMLQV